MQYSSYVRNAEYAPYPPYLGYIEPKPKSYTHANFEFAVNDYPPYSYFYPNPVECEDVCDKRVCNAYYNRKNNYYNCQRCQTMWGRNGLPMCWDAKKFKCVTCPRGRAIENCENRFGVHNPNGFPHNRVEPINPKYTGCATYR